MHSACGQQRLCGSEDWAPVQDDRFGSSNWLGCQRHSADAMLPFIQMFGLVPVNLHMGVGPARVGSA
eukprot:7496901-Pyramimonas_sp.AAC.1